jgi:hypothetical protein
MLSEKQAKSLLSECEQWLGKKLPRLREPLKKDHNSTKAHLWELIVLHAVASSIVSRQDKRAEVAPDISSQLQPEPDDATPDVFVHPDGCEPFWIEAAYIMPQQHDADPVRFILWVKDELFKRRIDFAKSLRVRLEPSDTAKDLEVPPSKRWDNLLSTNQWETFVSEISSGNLQSTWSLKEANVIVRIEGRGQGDYASSSFPPPGIPKGVEDNAVYKKIREKIEKQLQRWVGAGKTYQPLVLCIGASEGLHRLNASDIFSSEQLKQAVYSALADVNQWDWVTIMNLTGNRSWPWSMRSQRISGSELISAVVIVTIRNQDSGYGLVRRASKPLIIKNPHPNVELTAEQEQFLNQIDFNHVKYQSGRESWEPPHPKDAPDALNRYRLYEQTRGKYVLEPGPNEDFTIEIPSKIVAQFLAGNITADKVWNSNRLDADNYSNSTLSFKQDIGYFLRLAANNGQQIVNVNFVQVDPKLRDESRIRLEFGKITDPIEPINKNCTRASIESDAKGTFTLKLSTSLLTCLLAGKITADEAWRSENNQKIGDCLKKAVSKRQEIIDAKLIQVDSEFENEPQIILEFSAATDTTIREDKKR